MIKLSDVLRDLLSSTHRHEDLVEVEGLLLCQATTTKKKEFFFIISAQLFQPDIFNMVHLNRTFG